MTKDVSKVVDKITKLKIQMAREHRARHIRKKKCDHAEEINMRETELKSKENQLIHTEAEEKAELKKKKKRIVELTGVTK